MTKIPAVLLLSGGLDSTCIAAWKRPQLCLTVDYGQAAAPAEVAASKKICQLLGLEHETLHIDCSALGAGTLAGEARSPHSQWDEFWPYRNQLLLTFASAVALKHGIAQILAGSIATDDRHVDGTAEFYEAADELIVMQEGGVSVVAPAISMNCHELIEIADINDEALSRTHSCHVSPLACGRCAGCIKRAGALSAAGRLQ